jgi:glutaminyl-peptide cyclotransferase
MRSRPAVARAPGARRAARLGGIAALAGLVLGTVLPGQAAGPPPPAPTHASIAPARQLRWEVVGTHPHDPGAFLQGLVWHEGGFFESTGLLGRSTLRRVEFPSGRVRQRVTLPPDVFGEGLARVGDRLIQLTWKSGRAFVYDLATLRLLREFRYEGEGWGLAFDGASLIQSDGSDVLTYRDPQRFTATRRVAVTWNGRPLQRLNELEVIDGEVWANVWYTDYIVRIDPASGRVSSYLDLTGLLPQRPPDAVLNGIAYDPATRRVFVSGKLWPSLFEIRVR